MNSTIVIRLVLLVLLLAGGYALPWLFLGAAFVAWTLFEDLLGPKTPEPDEWFARRWTTTAADPRWKSDFLQFCESPAETAFLSAMIEAYSLVPIKGVLRGGGIDLNLQVKMPPYRADFIIHDWLVVEIDGAAFHSSPEAVQRDRDRDAFMREKGFRVLRIPAKLVFNAPREAIGLVRTELTKGRPFSQFLPDGQPKETIGQGLSKVAAAIGELNAKMQHIRVVEQALAGPRLTFSLEKQAIDSAIRLSQARR